MKLTIGENIRDHRRKHDLTQEELAERLGVSYQSVSRWENGTTYPDIELLPAISKLFDITVDELIGMPSAEKEERAVAIFDELRRECMKQDYDANHIVELLRDIRRDFIDSGSIWRPWVDGNDRAFRDPKILPEVRLLAEACLLRDPMNPQIIKTMAYIEDEEHLDDFLAKHTTSFDCSARTLLFNRYMRRGDAERFEPERRYQLFSVFDKLLCPNYLLQLNEYRSTNASADEFIEKLLTLIRRDAVDDRPDMWVCDRIELNISLAKYEVKNGELSAALSRLKKTVNLLEATMQITDEVMLPTSCRFLDGMEWRAKDDWHNPDNNPDMPEERMIYIYTKMSKLTTCYCLYPSKHLDALKSDTFQPLRDNPEFIELCERVSALIVTKTHEACDE